MSRQRGWGVLKQGTRSRAGVDGLEAQPPWEKKNKAIPGFKQEVSCQET